MNVIGRMQNNHYEKDGERVYGFQFTCEELDYLDSKAEAEARKGRDEWSDAYRRREADDRANVACTRRPAKGSRQAVPGSN